MAHNIYVGVAGKARRVRKAYVGVNGKARLLKKAYVRRGGVSRQVYGTFVPLETVSVTVNGTGTAVRVEGLVTPAGGERDAFNMAPGGTLEAAKGSSFSLRFTGGMFRNATVAVTGGVTAEVYQRNNLTLGLTVTVGNSGGTVTVTA